MAANIRPGSRKELLKGLADLTQAMNTQPDPKEIAKTVDKAAVNDLNKLGYYNGRP